MCQMLQKNVGLRVVFAYARIKKMSKRLHRTRGGERSSDKKKKQENGYR